MYVCFIAKFKTSQLISSSFHFIERRIRERIEQQAVYNQQMQLKAQRVAAEKEEEEQFRQMVRPVMCLQYEYYVVYISSPVYVGLDSKR